MTGVSGLCHKTHEWHQTEVTEPWHIKTQRKRGEGGRGAKPVPAGWPRRSQVSREGQECWAREAQAVQESQHGTRARTEGRTREAPAKQEPQQMARVGPEGQTRWALVLLETRQEARVETAAWQSGREEPVLMRELAEQGAWAEHISRVESVSGQGDWVEPAGQGAWVEPAGQRWPPGRQRTPGLPPGLVGWRKPSSSSYSDESGAVA